MAYELSEKSKEQLWELAKKLDLKLPPALGREKLEEAVEIALIKRQHELEERAIEDRRLEAKAKLGNPAGSARPAPETVAIEASKKVYVNFLNLEHPQDQGEPGADVEFCVGDKYRFHMWDSRTHVLPKCLVVKKPDSDPNLLARMTEFWTAAGLKGEAVNQQAVSQLRGMSLANRCTTPIYQFSKTPDGHQVMTKTGETKRFEFSILGPAPDTEPFGLTVKEIDYEDVA